MVIEAQLRDLRFSRRMASERTSERAFFGVSALLFAASAATTIVWCASMSAMSGMPMPGQTWPSAAAAVEMQQQPALARAVPIAAGERVARAIGAVVVGQGCF